MGGGLLTPCYNMGLSERIKALGGVFQASYLCQGAAECCNRGDFRRPWQRESRPLTAALRWNGLEKKIFFVTY